MYFLYRYWERYRIALLFLLLSGGAAWLVRQTHGAAVMEVYRLLSLPFQPNAEAQQLLLQSQTWELQQRITALETQNQQLQVLLKQPAIAQSKNIAAPIIARSADNWWQQLTLGKGSQDGLKVGAVVSAPGGLVGRITSVTAYTSRVLLLTDPNSRVGVVAGRSRDMGILKGQSDQQAVLEFFEKDPKVQAGDPVLTSMLSSLFPANLAIGQIESVDLSNTANPKAIVQLAAPLSNLEWVIVTLNARTPQTMVSPRP
jgi:rod shape-determining protein MreC